ncbi:gamma-aminobutyric acid receptor subunit delta-like [Rhipicephalus sanguineus]|uniref:gamma-aminobutyric acid receptor subunit delta-like n=1 Tax=Rhipicephalus sanguineus TaxID=34632 RepID=UPI0020C2F5FB|nr:gamma-aminobutyric acid receptor subunit delta-like [Rhipicephalus sanguineus]
MTRYRRSLEMVSEGVEGMALILTPNKQDAVLCSANISLGAPIWLSVEVEDVNNFNERTMRFSLTLTTYHVYLTSCTSVRRISHPYALLPAGDNVLERHYIGHVFVPDTFIDEAVNVHLVPSMEKLEYTYTAEDYRNDVDRKQCFFAMTTKLNTTVTCLMTFSYFPMDTQTCYLTLRSYSYPKHILRYLWNRDNLTIEKDRFRVPEYNVTISKIAYEPTGGNEDTTGEERARLRLRFQFRRQIERHLVDTFVPTAFLVVLSWLSFWLGTKNTQPRVALCAVVLVATLQHLTAARNSLPPSRTWTGLDIWTILCLGFVFTSIVEVTFVCYCSHTTITYGYSSPPNTEAPRHVGRFEEVEPDISGIPEIPRTKNRSSRLGHDIGGIHKRTLGTAERTDRFCRVAFPAAFFVSNIMYWSWLYVNRVKSQ